MSHTIEGDTAARAQLFELKKGISSTGSLSIRADVASSTAHNEAGRADFNEDIELAEIPTHALPGSAADEPTLQKVEEVNILYTNWGAHVQYMAVCWAVFLIGWNDGTTGPLLPRIQAYYQVSLHSKLCEFCLQLSFSCVPGGVCSSISHFCPWLHRRSRASVARFNIELSVVTGIRHRCSRQCLPSRQNWVRKGNIIVRLCVCLLKPLSRAWS